MNLIASIQTSFSKFGIYRSSFISFLLKLIRSPILAYLIVIYLNPEELGYWYTYQSIGSFIIIFEFGISKLITLYVATFINDFKKLNFKDKIKVFETHSSRVFLSLYFYIFIYIISVLLLFISGKFYFSNWGEKILLPFSLFLIGFGLSLFYNFYINFLYGFGFVKKRNLIENWYGLISFFFTLIFLFYGFKLYALGLSLLLTNLLIYALDYKYVSKWLKKYYNYNNRQNYDGIIQSLENLHWKYFATNVFSLYIFNSLTIIAMKYFNAILAGQIGFTLFIFTSITGISNVFFYTKYPIILSLIEEKNILHLRSVIKKLLFYMLFVYSFCVIIFLILVEALKILESKYILNILPMKDLIFISIVNFIAIIIGLLAQIVRAHKVEPYWKIAVFQCFTSSLFYYLIIKFNNIHLYFILDTFLYLFILLPFHLYIGKNVLMKYIN